VATRDGRTHRSNSGRKSKQRTWRERKAKAKCACASAIIRILYEGLCTGRTIYGQAFKGTSTRSGRSQDDRRSALHEAADEKPRIRQVKARKISGRINLDRTVGFR